MFTRKATLVLTLLGRCNRTLKILNQQGQLELSDQIRKTIERWNAVEGLLTICVCFVAPPE